VLLTIVHTAISLIGIFSGFVVARGFVTANRMDTWTAVFLTTTVLTSLTGFLFPRDHVMPGHIVGVISLLVLAPTIAARYRYRLAGGWRRTYVIGSIVALYFNFFVLIAQLFAKVPPLKELAPTQTEAPFAIAQILALIGFVALGIRSVRRFRPDGASPGVPPAHAGPSAVTP
jgi:hypothetical protein